MGVQDLVHREEVAVDIIVIIRGIHIRTDRTKRRREIGNMAVPMIPMINGKRKRIKRRKKRKRNLKRKRNESLQMKKVLRNGVHHQNQKRKRRKRKKRNDMKP